MGKRNVSEVEEKYFEKLRKPIGELTCKGVFWGKDGALALERKRINVLRGYDLENFIKINENYEKRDFLLSTTSAASSTYYAGGGNAGSQAEVSNLFSKIFWYWRGWKCLRMAEKLSDKFARLKPMKDMSLGELDTRACILHKSGRRNEALKYLRQGLIRQTGTKHDLCLFLIHEAEILAEMKACIQGNDFNDAETNYIRAMKLSEDKVVPALTKVRVMKSYGKFLAENKKINVAEGILGEALDLARENHLYDQERKIKAIFKSFKLIIR